MRLLGKDKHVEVDTSDLVNVLHNQLTDDAKGRTIKLFYSGKQMQGDKPIGMYTTADSVVTVFFQGLPTSA